MSEKRERKPIPSEVFEAVVDALRQELGADWLKRPSRNESFNKAMTSVIQVTEGVHLIGNGEENAELPPDSTTYRVWVDFPVNDMWDADDLAFELFAQVSEDIFVCTREIGNGGVTYRFVSGTMDAGHLGTLIFAGPHARDFANLYTIRSTSGGLFHA